MEEFARVSNNNNRSLQKSIKGFSKRPIKIKNQKIRDFNVSPLATKAYIAKVKEEAAKQQRKNIAFYTIMVSVIAILIYFFWYVLPYLNFWSV